MKCFRLKVIQYYSNDYAYNTASKVVIKYWRFGRRRVIRATLRHTELGNVVFMIRRGFTHEEVLLYIKETIL